MSGCFCKHIHQLKTHAETVKYYSFKIPVLVTQQPKKSLQGAYTALLMSNAKFKNTSEKSVEWTRIMLPPLLWSPACVFMQTDTSANHSLPVIHSCDYVQWLTLNASPLPSLRCCFFPPPPPSLSSSYWLGRRGERERLSFSGLNQTVLFSQPS